MITYNWDIAIKIVVILYMISLSSTIISGLLKLEKGTTFNWRDSVMGFIILCIMMLPYLY